MKMWDLLNEENKDKIYKRIDKDTQFEFKVEQRKDGVFELMMYFAKKRKGVVNGNSNTFKWEYEEIIPKRKPTEKMLKTLDFIIENYGTALRVVHKENLPDRDDFSEVYKFIKIYLPKTYERIRVNLAWCEIIADMNRSSMIKSANREKYRPHEGQHKYYADDIETYKGGRWVSKVKEDIYRFHDKPSRPSSGLPRTKYDEPERNGHHW